MQDPDGIFALWRQIVTAFAATEKAMAESYLKIFDPDQAPEIFVKLMLKNLGNPFNKVFLTLTQKRKLVKALIPIYRQKGTRRGIINAVRFLTGIIVDIVDPHGVEEDGWRVGVSEIGSTTFVGGDRVYCNMLNWTEDFEKAVWAKANGANVVPDDTQGPLPWVRPADLLLLPNPNSSILQEVLPFFVGNEPFFGSIFLKASAPVTLKAKIFATDDPADFTEVNFNVTTDWQRFLIQHTMEPNQPSVSVTFQIYSTAGTAEDIWAFGAQLVRNDEAQPYAQSTDDGEDCSYPGRWAYHFFIVTEVELTPEQEAIIRMIADYMKTAHTHYTLVFPGNDQIPNVFNHWMIGVSQIGVNTYVHP